MNVIELNDVTKVFGFGEAATIALDGVDLSIEEGEFIAIMGPSGSGKSTLMNIIGLLDHPSHGLYELDGENVSRYGQNKRAKLRREKIGFIFQSFNLLPKLTALENVSLPLTYSGHGHVSRLEKAAEFMERVGLGNRQYYMPNQLSGGQVQRVAVARALVNTPSIVLADEPTGNLDTVSSENIMNLLADIHQGGNTIVMVTHNPELAKYAQRVITMKDGKIDEDKQVNKSKKADVEHEATEQEEPEHESESKIEAEKETKATEEKTDQKPVKKSKASKKKRKSKKKKKGSKK